MNKVQLRLFSFVFAALLPPKKDKASQDESDDNYYQRLGLSSSCTAEDIRKAYKKKSLMYHPDKVAQFARSNTKSPAEIQEEFVKIKEAYEVLSDPSKRDSYDILGDGANMVNGTLDPQALTVNLAMASYFDKTKLFLLVLLAVAIVLIGPLLICLKVDALHFSKNFLLNVDWVLILIPIYVFQALLLILALIGQDYLSCAKMVSFLILMIFLALKWDGSIQWDYRVILIPLYVYHLLSALKFYVTMRGAKESIGRMVTVSYFEDKILPTWSTSGDGDEENVNRDHRSYTDLTDEELDEVNQNYIFVNEEDEWAASPDDEASADASQASIIAELKLLKAISNSPEFLEAKKVQKFGKRSIISFITYRVPFLVLLTLKLSDDKGWDWNIVFIPIWIEVILSTLSNCFGCCCADFFTVEEIIDEYPGSPHSRTSFNMDQNKGIPTNTVFTETKDESLDSTSLFTPTNSAFAETKDESLESTSLFPVEMKEVTSDETKPLTVDGREEQQSNSPLSTENSKDMANMTGEDKATYSQDVEEDGEEDADESSEIPMDSETAEKSLRSCGQFCNNIVLILVMTLFIVKLNEAEDTDVNKGFSAIWIIFPLLLVSGLILCFCFCCIYAKIQADDLENMMGSMRVPGKNGQERDRNDEEEIVSPLDADTKNEPLQTSATPATPPEDDLD